MKEILFIIFLNKHQRHFEVIYITDSVVQFSLIARQDETNDIMNKSQQSIRRI